MSLFGTNNQPKLCFFHIPRTGGTTLVKDVLFRNFSLWRLCHVNYDMDLNALHGAHDPLRWSGLRRAGVRLLAGHMPFGFASRFPGTFEHITFLRDPVARTVSDYHFARQHSSNPASAAARCLTLAEFVRSNYGTSNNGYAHWLSNAVFGARFSTETEMLDAALRNLALCSFVGITERFASSVRQLCGKYGLEPHGTTETNRNRATPVGFLLSREDRTVIERHNRLDLAIYSFALRQTSIGGVEAFLATQDDRAPGIAAGAPGR